MVKKLANKQSNHGGRRTGAGRPKHTGNYREATTAIRVPQSLLSLVKSLLEQKKAQQSLSADQASAIESPMLTAISPVTLALKFYTSQVAAGKPAAADDHSDEVLDLNELLVKQPENTYCVRVSGDSMIDAGIFPGDVLIVEHATEARHGQIVIAAVNGEFTVKRYHISADKIYLIAANKHYDPMEITNTMSFQLWGVVTGLARKFQ